MHSTIEEKIVAIAEAAESAGAQQAARTAQLEAVKQQLKNEQESRGNQVRSRAVQAAIGSLQHVHCSATRCSKISKPACMLQDAMMLDEPGHMLDLMDEDRTGTAMHGRPKRRR